MKIALGTVQFGQRYGVSNSRGQVPVSEVIDILNSAQSCGADTIDTAASYGTSEEVLGEIGVEKWRVISKLPPLPAYKVDVEQWVRDQIHGSLHRLRLESLDGMLLHRPSDLLGNEGDAYRIALRDAKSAGLIKSVGVSIYRPEELDAICAQWRPDLIQAPCSILDRRLIQSGWLQRLQKMGVRVHVRSAFLQGLLLMRADRLPAYFAPWSNLLDRWAKWCEKQNITPLQGALGYVSSLPGIERVVLGVDSLAQFHDISQAITTTVATAPQDLACDDLDLIEPYRWKLT